MGARDDGSLEGQVALVTGASRGIGRATALALAARGAALALLARNAAAVEAVAAEVRASGGRAVALSADVADWPAVERAVARAREALGPIALLINNAGTHGAFGYVWELDPEPFRRTLAVNVLGPFHLARAVLPEMVERRRGTVINVSSGVARGRPVARSAYGTSKAALDQLSNVLAAEAKPFGVRVHVFYPGFVDTELQAELRTAPGLPAEVQAEFVARQREGRLQSPEQPAAALAWLASPAGVAWPDLLLNWADPATRERVEGLPGFRGPAR